MLPAEGWWLGRRVRDEGLGVRGVPPALTWAMPRERDGVAPAEPEPTETGPIATVG